MIYWAFFTFSLNNFPLSRWHIYKNLSATFWRFDVKENFDLGANLLPFMWTGEIRWGKVSSGRVRSSKVRWAIMQVDGKRDNVGSRSTSYRDRPHTIPAPITTTTTTIIIIKIIIIIIIIEFLIHRKVKTSWKSDKNSEVQGQKNVQLYAKNW